MPSRRERANAIRALSMDAVQKANSGHPGAPMGMADIAEVLWRDYLKHNPANPNFAEAWSNKGVLLEREGQYEQAAEAYRHALSLDHAAVICMHNLGMLYINHLNRRPEGLSWLKNTLKYDPQRWFKLPSELRSAVDAASYID